MRRFLQTASIALVVSAVEPPAQAHLGKYLFTSTADLLDRGDLALELMAQRREPREGDGHWLLLPEAQFGIGRGFDGGLGARVIEGEGLSAVEGELRHRLPSYGPYHLAVQVEGQAAVSDEESNGGELRLIGTRSVGLWSFAANAALEYEKEHEPGKKKEWELVPAATFRAAYRLRPRLTPAIEVIAVKENSQIAPALTIGLREEAKVSLGVGFGIGEESDRYNFKAVFELEFGDEGGL